MTTTVENSASPEPPPLTPCLPKGRNPLCSLQNLKDVTLSPLAVTLVFLLTGMYINCVAQVWAQYRSKQIDASTLPDVGFDILPSFDPLLADLATYGAMLITLVRFFFGVTANNHRIRRHIFRRHIFCLGTLFFFRAFSIISTMLPNPADYCVTDVQYSPWYEALRILSGATVTCADVMYSGHTVNITLCSMTWHCYSHVVPINSFDPLFSKFGPLANKLGELQRLTTVKAVVWASTFLGYCFIIGSRFHYTLDVFIGSLLTITFFKFHQSRIRLAHLNDTWFNKIILWSETGAEDMVWFRENLSIANDEFNHAIKLELV